MRINQPNSGECHLDPVLLWVKVWMNSLCLYCINASVRNKRNPQICHGLLSEMYVPQMPPNDLLQFHICCRSGQSEMNVKTLQINPGSDRSSISCQRYHFPSKWYGWQFDNCHPDPASLKHSPKTHQILQGRWDEITDGRNLPSLSENTTICRDVYKRRYVSRTST